MIGVHIEFDVNRKAWFVSEGTPSCPLMVTKREDEKTWLQAVFDEYSVPFQISRGPLIRFLWIRGEQVTELVAFAQHSICDGLSLVFLLRDFLSLLGDPYASLVQQHYLPTLRQAYDLDSINLNPFLQKVVTKFNALWKQHQVHFTEEDFRPLHEAFQTHHLNAVLWALDKDVTEKFTARCHQENVSVNSALYCAILVVQHQLQGDREAFRKNILMPVSIRNFVKPPIGEGVGLFAGGEGFSVKMKWRLPFWRQARQMHQELQKRIRPESIFANARKVMQLDPTFMDARVMLFLGAMLPKPPPKYQELLRVIENDRLLAKMKAKKTQNQIQLGSVLTNIGALKIPEKYGPYLLDNVIFLPPNSPLAEKLIGVVTYKNRLQGTIAFAEKSFDAQIAARFSSVLVEFIKTMIE